jgi:hypothetical protein
MSGGAAQVIRHLGDRLSRHLGDRLEERFA